jgi:exopolysaccharide biosynthesis protein
MKIFAFIIIVLGTIGFIYVRNNTSIPNDTSFDSNQSPTLSPSQAQSGLRTSWFIVDDIENLSLRSNLSDQLSAKEAKDKYECTRIISGGFYSDSETQGKDGKHIGLFVTEGETLSPYKGNSLFNGFLHIENESATISSNVPSNSDIALQTGPLLMTSGNPRKLSLVRDEKARRMVAATTSDNKLLFMTFFESSSYVSGPKLAELPELVKKLGEEEQLEIIDAINLDGGAHSAFITDEVTLTDIQTPGSYFCVKD